MGAQPQTEFAAERERQHRAVVADVLLQMIVQGVVTKDATPTALAALGLAWPDLDAAMTRRRRFGWRGPTRPSGETIQVGWVRFDGDEFCDFRYSAPGDMHAALMNAGWVPLYVDADKVPGA